ncbi:uncharacterized protein MONOS_15238 [Monocercomonoides exilis]|uniref:uncharacterized protein n=1 Tax=Monocercomonoides exilis TaxID=2049356 RepID=UPI0035593AD6|nr:hypothetical protein MONOS_15238 [Monocercomonoides exilis]|eukprot:MONOS_15238.1-p1 / transcript=MONOS_15238.1 / gene=MONOS_15238 / organism=Monocercomonoides_exilis_PA203 / gene_product=unspecified product / transcript_product=unspecified product / location=Mono_scaffold01175:6227-7185(-) / protein_length=236 / sequence_SO=supercontig / SO=protein_coding / is_pseudo=false
MHFHEQAGSNSTIYSNSSAPPFIPEAIHPIQRTSNWCYDALEQNGFKIEEKLLWAIKALIIGKDMVDKGLDPSAKDPIYKKKIQFKQPQKLQENQQNLELQPMGSLKKVGERTRLFLKNWSEIGARRIVEKGACPVWRSREVRNKLKKEVKAGHGFIGSQEQERECEKWRTEALDCGILKRVKFEDAKCLSKLFSVKKKNGKWRQILDCRPLNKALKSIKFKLEDHRTVEKLMEK